LPTSLERITLESFSGEGGLGHLNAYFTPLAVTRAMWTLLERAGFEGGRALEPSLGSGHFAVTAPNGVSLTGVELDPDAALLARLLHPSVTVIEGSFEAFTTISDSPLFDAAIGNPPFGARGLSRDLHKPELSDAESYFTLAVLERLKTGGLTALILPAGVMHNSSSKTLRAQMLCLAEVRLCARLPLETFEGVGAQVTPDVWLLQRREAGVGEALLERLRQDGEASLETLGVARQDVLSGHYFCRLEDGVLLAGHHPQRALGELALSPRYGTPTVRGTLAEALSQLETLSLDPTHPLGLERVLSSCPPERRAAVQLASTRQYPIPEGGRSSDGLRLFKRGRWTTDAALENEAFKQGYELARALAAYRCEGRALPPAAREARRAFLADRVLSYALEHGDPHKNPTLARNLRSLSTLAHLLSAYQGGQLSPDLLADAHPSLEGELSGACERLLGSGQLTVERLSQLSDTPLEQVCAFLAQ